MASVKVRLAKDTDPGALSVVRGFISGTILGAILVVALLAVVSLMGEQPPGNAPPAAPLVSSPENATPSADAGGSDVANAAGLEAIGTDGRSPAAPEVSDASSTAPLADTSSAALPQTGIIEGALPVPGTEDGAAVQANGDAAVLPNPQAMAPALPTAEDPLSISTDPSQPMAPEMAEDSAPAAALPVVVLDEEPALPSVTEVEAEPLSPAVSQAPELPKFGLTGTPASTMPASDDAVRIIRPDTDAEQSDAEAAITSFELTGVALNDFAAASEPTDLPKLALILLDDGQMVGGPEALGAAETPVTIAIDPTQDGATALMRAYRAQGIEVMAVAKLPQAALPSDIEVVLAAGFDVLPEAIGLLDVDGSGLPGAGAALDQTMAVLAADGRGLVTVSRGLNAPVRAAEAADVPSAVLYRDLDGADQDARVIRRFLDQAAFRARQEGQVVLMGRVRPATISALILWSTANRAGQVAQVPLSAVLTAD